MLPIPIVVNMFGKPCAGKTKTAWKVAAALKELRVHVEYVNEFPKDLTWEQRHITLGFQPYIFGKQLRNIERLFGGVDVVVTDGPLMLSSFYTEHNAPRRYPESFHRFVLDMHNSIGGLNYYLSRVGSYNPHGRSQTEAEADVIGVAQLKFLRDRGIYPCEIIGDENAHKAIVSDILSELSIRQSAEEESNQ